jgi:hypothetical protein
MDKIELSSRPITLDFQVRAPEVRTGKVTGFGTGGAHIVFSKDYLNYEVLIIPLKKVKEQNENRKLAKSK